MLSILLTYPIFIFIIYQFHLQGLRPTKQLIEQLEDSEF